VRAMQMRGGTSKGLYFLADDLPADPAERDDLLLRVMGSPDPRQIDGAGGAHPLTSKVAVVSPSAVPGVAVDYLFLQVMVDQPVVTDQQNCGNIPRHRDAGPGQLVVEPGRGPVAEVGRQRRVQRPEHLHEQEDHRDRGQRPGQPGAAFDRGDEGAGGDREPGRQQPAGGQQRPPGHRQRAVGPPQGDRELDFLPLPDPFEPCPEWAFPDGHGLILTAGYDVA
jgi:hypothetical protein